MYCKEVTDTEAIIQVIHAAFARYQEDPMPSSALLETAETICQNMRSGVVIYGAFIEEQLVAVVKVEQKEHTYYFSRLAVLPTMQRRGIAQQLIAFIEQLATEHHMLTMQCKVRKSETQNIALYKKLGYTIVQENVTTSSANFTMAVLTMEKAL